VVTEVKHCALGLLKEGRLFGAAFFVALVRAIQISKDEVANSFLSLRHITNFKSETSSIFAAELPTGSQYRLGFTRKVGMIDSA